MTRLSAPPPPVRADSAGGWTKSDLTPPAPAHEDWVVTNVAAAVRPIEDDLSGGIQHGDDGTPVEGVVAPPPPPALTSENSFVAGEIDVPTPAPENAVDKTPAVEFTAASSLLGNAEPADPDTGSRTPPIERRSS